MPLTKIHAPAHLPSTQLGALAEAVQQALVNTCAVPPDDLFQLISRYGPDDIILDPHFGGVDRSATAVIIEILFLAGRGDDQKRALFRHISEGAARAGFRADDIMVALTENTRMDWSLGQGVAYADHHAKPGTSRPTGASPVTGIDIPLQPDPVPYVLGLWVGGILAWFLPQHTGSVWPGIAIPFCLLLLLGTWWLTRPRALHVSFATREAIYQRHPILAAAPKTISLAPYTRVYAAPLYRYAGWSIHLNGPQGEHRRLMTFTCRFGDAATHREAAKAVCTRLAAGLGITDGGEGGPP